MQLLVVRQLDGLAAAGRRVVLLVDALDEAQDRGNNMVVRLLQKLGKAQTRAVSAQTPFAQHVCFFIHPKPFVVILSESTPAFFGGDNAAGA